MSEHQTLTAQPDEYVKLSRMTWRKTVAKKIRKHWQLYLVILLPMVYIILFKYVPMVGAQIAFRDYNFMKGFWGSHWVGLKHFKQFFLSPNFWPLLKNTIQISVYALAIGFPVPIILALALNEVGRQKFKKFVQMVTYAPYFISTVVMVSMLLLFLSPDLGVLNRIMMLFGAESINFMGEPGYFKTIYVLSEVWQQAGYGAVIYIAALSGISPHLYEAAKVDGASRLQKIIHIDIPGILPAVVILLILNVGQIMKIGYEKIYLMQNTLNLTSSEIIATYVYKVGLLGANFSYSTAVGEFNSVISLVLILTVNFLAKKLTQSSLW